MRGEGILYDSWRLACPSFFLVGWRPLPVLCLVIIQGFEAGGGANVYDPYILPPPPGLCVDIL